MIYIMTNNWLQKKYHTDEKYRKSHLEKVKKYNKIKNKKLKDELYKKLGGYVCSCNGIKCWHNGKCNITDKRVLQLDHINGNGRKEEKITNQHGSAKYRMYLKMNNIENHLQVFCSNCNWVKKFNKNEIRL